VEELICLLGTLFIDCFRELDKETPIGRWLAPPDKTPLKNVGLIMGLAIGASGCWLGDAESMDFWSQEIERMAEARGIQLRDCNGPIKDKSDGTKKLDFSAQVCCPPLTSFPRSQDSAYMLANYFGVIVEGV